MSRSYRDVLYEGIDRLRKSGAEEPEADARVLFDNAFRIDPARYLLTEHETAPQEGTVVSAVSLMSHSDEDSEENE